MGEAVLQGELVGITIITKIEILQGRMAAVLKADTHARFLNAQQALITTEERLQKAHIVRLDESALSVFDGLILARGLKKVGRADLLIASITRACQATLVTRNRKHFQLIPRLKIINWVD
jgi:tRNA(fMet)-specific endonuclease VapC